MPTGLLISDTAVNCVGKTDVAGFELAGAQPVGTDRRIVFKIGGLAARGSRTYPITANAAAGDTVIIGGVTFTAVAAAAAAGQFNVGATLAETAANLAAALNADVVIAGRYTASASSAVVTLMEKIAAGNTPAEAALTGAIAIGGGTAVTSVPAWYKLTAASGPAALAAVATQAITADSVLAEGNTVDELAAVTSVPAFAGKEVYPAIALSAAPDAVELPTLKLAIKGLSNQDQYTRVEQSPEYVLSADGDVAVIDVSAAVAAADGGSAVVEAALKQSGLWSEYMPLSAVKNKTASVIRFKATYTATTLGVSSAKVNSVTAVARTNAAVVSGATADLVTVTQVFENGMLYARLLVKHQRLQDARLKAYISFSDTTECREMHLIGTGTGERQTVTLADAGLDHNGMRLYFDRQEIFDFDYNTATSQISFTAPADANVFLSYTYGLQAEEWQEMQRGSTQKYRSGNLYSTIWTYAVPAGTEKGVSAIRVVLEKPPGSTTDAALGVGTGKRQLFVLDHYAREETIAVKASGTEVARSTWSYDDVNRILTITAPKDAPLTYSCLWTAETPVITGLVAAWNE